MKDKFKKEKIDDPAPPAALDYQSIKKLRHISHAKRFANLSLFFAVIDIPLIISLWCLNSVRISPQIDHIIWRSLDILIYCSPYVGFMLGILSIVLAFRERRYSLCFVGLLAILISSGFLAIFSIHRNLN